MSGEPEANKPAKRGKGWAWRLRSCRPGRKRVQCWLSRKDRKFGFGEGEKDRSLELGVEDDGVAGKRLGRIGAVESLGLGRDRS